MKFLSNILVKAGLVVEGTTDLQGTATTITQSSSDSSTKIATTAFVKNQGYAVGNVYTTDGSLSGNRTINLNGSYLDIAGLTTTRFFANGNVVIDGASPVDAGFKLDVAGTGRYTGILYANSRLNVNGATDSVNYQLNVTGRIRSSGQMESGAQVYGATGGIFNGVGIGAKTFTGPGYNYDTNNWIVASNSTTQPWAFYITNVQGINSISSRGAIIRFALTTTAGVEAGITNIQNNSDFAYVQFSGQYTTTAFGTQGEVYRVNRIDGQITDANARLFSWVGHTISPVLSSGLSNATIRGYFYNPTLTVTPANNIAFEATSGIMKLGNLAGTGTRMVVADSSGVLSTQAIPSGNAGTVTSIATTGPITGGTITSSGTIGITQATTSTDGYLSSTDWNTFNNKQAALGFTPVTNARTITINGTTFDLTANRSWSVGNLTGSLTSGYIPKATGSSSLADGLIYDTGSAVLIGTQTASSAKFMVYSTSPDNHYQAVGSAPSFRFADTINSPSYTGIFGLATASNHFIIGAAAGDMVLSNNTTSAIGNFIFGTGATERMRISPAGNVSINNTNNTYRFDVNGTVRFTGQLRLESTITNGTHTYTLPSATGTLALTSQLTGGTVTSVGLSSATSGVTIGSTPVTTSGTITLAIATASGSQQGLLSSTDWTTFNNKQNALTNPVTGTGTTNYLPKFTGTSTIGNSLVYDNGTQVAVATSNPSGFGTQRFLAVGNGAASQVARFTDGANGDLVFDFPSATISRITAQYGTGGNLVFANGTGFTEQMRLTSSGNLSIGNTNNTYKLDVTGTGRFTSNLTTDGIFIGRTTNGQAFGVGNGVDSDMGIFVQTNNIAFSNSGTSSGISFALGGTTRFSIASTGAATFSSSVTAGGKITSATGAFRAGGFYIPYSTSSTSSRTWAVTNDEVVFGDFSILTSTTQTGDVNLYRLYINPAGNVGIGTTSPNRNTEIISSSGAVLGVSSSANGAGILYGRIAMYTNAASNSYIDYGGEIRSYSGAGIDNSDLRFYTANATPSVERMRITNGGRVGIGTTDIDAKLKVYSDSETNLLLSTVSKSSVNIVAQKQGVGYTDLDIDANIIKLFTNNNERLRITANGYLVLGASTSVYGQAGRGTFEMNGSADNILAQRVGGSLANYLYSNASFTELYSTNPLLISVSGVERMRITSGGNVGIGTTSPGQRLTADAPFGQPATTGTTQNGVFRIQVDQGAGWGEVLDMGMHVGISGPPSYAWLQGTNKGNHGINYNIAINPRGGNVGIGTTSPTNYISGTETSLHVYNSNAATLNLASGGGNIYSISSISGNHLIFFNASTGSERMRINGVGDVLINTTSAFASGKLCVNGIGAFGGVYSASLGTGSVFSNAGNLTNTNPSDLRLKNTIKPLTYGLNEVLQLNPKTFYYNDDATRARLKYGFIAQEVKEVMPDLVRRLGSDNDYLGLETEGIYVALVNAIKELKQELDILKNK